MDAQQAWQQFVASGRVEDYLGYRMACAGEEQGGAELADRVRRSGSAGTAAGGARQAADSANP